MEQGTRDSGGEAADDGGGGGGKASGEAGPARQVIRWDQIFTRRSLRVLLVEHDDSTRHVVTALLRKCSYIVVAVADGLKAWEIMQERRFAFDLVLTEVVMPSLSGIGLLTKVISTEECKSVPVIMMSSQDSIAVVLKCMLKGAADFLVKPVRRNELRNLWQHVWRRQFSSQASASENNAASNRISVNVNNTDDMFKTGENSDDSNGAQSSESKQEMEIESAQYFGQIASAEDQNHNTERVSTSTTEEAKEPAPTVPISLNKDRVDFSDPINDENGGNAESKSAPSFCEEKILSGKSIMSTKSDLAEFFKPPAKAKDVLNHSEGSAFARYGEKKIQNSNSNTSSLCFKNDGYIQTDQNPSTSLQSKSGRTNHTQLRFIPVPVPIGSVPYGYTTILHPIYYTSFPPPENLTAQIGSDESNYLNCIHNNNNDNNNNNAEIVEKGDSGKMLQQETNQNQNQMASCSHNMDYMIKRSGSNESGEMMKGNLGAALESGNESSAQTGDRSRREAALIKFRLKRKDRCFEKKVRYYNRKKLAEQRPRVKGQFVSQKANGSDPPTETGVNIY